MFTNFSFDSFISMYTCNFVSRLFSSQVKEGRLLDDVASSVTSVATKVSAFFSYV